MHNFKIIDNMFTLAFIARKNIYKNDPLRKTQF